MRKVDYGSGKIGGYVRVNKSPCLQKVTIEVETEGFETNTVGEWEKRQHISPL